MFQPIGEVELNPDAIGGRRREVDQRGFILRFAAAQKNELGVERQKVGALKNEVEPLLSDHASSHPEERNLATLRQPEGTLQRRLAAPFSIQIVSRVLRRDLTIGRGIP